MSEHKTSDKPQNPYWDALWSAWLESQELKKQEQDIAIRKARVNATINALWPLVFPESTDINSLGLANAIRIVFGGTGRPLSSIEVRGKLQDLGFDLSQFSNPLASIHTATRRMVDSGELVDVPAQDVNSKPKIAAGPELKSVPEISAEAASCLEEGQSPRD